MGILMENKKRSGKIACSCEICEYYDYDETDDTYSCRLSLDEDEEQRFRSGNMKDCPYFKFYDEYKSVQKQN